MQPEWRRYVFAVLIVAAATLIFIQGRAHFAKEQWALLYLLIIVFVAGRSGVRPAVLAATISFFCWNFFFLPPYHTFHVYDPKDWLSLFVFLIVGIIMGMQTGRLREREALARIRGQETALLNKFSAHLVSDLSIGELADVLDSEVAGSVNARCAILFTPTAHGALVKVGVTATSCDVDEYIIRLVEWSFTQSKAVGLPGNSDPLNATPNGWPISVSHAEVGIDNP
ncbi:MAG TPA: DUF4118 domain-containing protein, partial [Armatimonadota bacterium]